MAGGSFPLSYRRKNTGFDTSPYLVFLMVNWPCLSTRIWTSHEIWVQKRRLYTPKGLNFTTDSGPFEKTTKNYWNGCHPVIPFSELYFDGISYWKNGPEICRGTNRKAGSWCSLRHCWIWRSTFLGDCPLRNIGIPWEFHGDIDGTNLILFMGHRVR